jgi:hypothetical protein
MKKIKRNTAKLTPSARPYSHEAVPGDKPYWVKVTVTYPDFRDLAAGYALTNFLLERGLAQMAYFSRYTSFPYRLEIQMLTINSTKLLKTRIAGYRHGNVAPTGVSFEACNGSLAHGVAFLVIRAMVAENRLTAAQLVDVSHWMFNMAGFSYIQEAALTAMQSYYAVRGVTGWTEAPVFGTKLDRKKHERIRPAKKRKG